MVVNLYLVNACEIDVAVGTVPYQCLVITQTPLYVPYSDRGYSQFDTLHWPDEVLQWQKRAHYIAQLYLFHQSYNHFPC